MPFTSKPKKKQNTENKNQGGIFQKKNIAKVPWKWHSIYFQQILVLHEFHHQDCGLFPVAAPAAGMQAVGPWQPGKPGGSPIRARAL